MEVLVSPAQFKAGFGGEPASKRIRMPVCRPQSLLAVGQQQGLLPMAFSTQRANAAEISLFVT